MCGPFEDPPAKRLWEIMVLLEQRVQESLGIEWADVGPRPRTGLLEGWCLSRAENGVTERQMLCLRPRTIIDLHYELR
jgi:hypothetical protein